MQGTHQMTAPSVPLLGLFEDVSGLKSPPKATLARRAKSYSDFYDAATGYLSKDAKQGQSLDVLEVLENKPSEDFSQSQYEKFEDDLLDASQAEYQYVKVKPLMKI